MNDRPDQELEALAVERDPETPKLSLAFSYYGRRYMGELLRVTGKGAEVRFRTKSDHPRFGRVRVRRIDRENHQPRVVGGRLQLNDLARAATAATSFHALTDAPGGYVPAFCCDRFLSGLLADEYDGYQERRGDPRRASRIGEYTTKGQRAERERRARRSRR